MFSPPFFRCFSSAYFQNINSQEQTRSHLIFQQDQAMLATMHRHIIRAIPHCPQWVYLNLTLTCHPLPLLPLLLPHHSKDLITLTHITDILPMTTTEIEHNHFCKSDDARISFTKGSFPFFSPYFCLGLFSDDNLSFHNNFIDGVRERTCVWKWRLRIFKPHVLWKLLLSFS